MTMWEEHILLIEMNTCFCYKHIFDLVNYALIWTQTSEKHSQQEAGPLWTSLLYNFKSLSANLKSSQVLF